MNVAVFDPADRSLSYASAGHPPPFLRRAATGEIHRLATGHGPVLGPVPDVSYAQGYVTVEPGDIVVMYTDGLIERRGQDIEAGMMRAQSLIAQWSDDVSLPGACRALTEAMAPAPRNDDVCVVALRFGV
jgi:serine phosphatase RsbU (regulator of sigma subunit)